MATHPRIVVGLDYGTTYTGIAWMNVRDEAPQLDQLRVHRSWPGAESTKVPSLISFSRTVGGHKQWGHDIDPESVVMRFAKLDLQPQPRREELEKLRDTVKGLGMLAAFRGSRGAGAANDVPYYLGFDSEDIVARYLQKVARAWLEVVETDAATMLNNVPVDLVVTHPGVWSYPARNKTVRAVRAAFAQSWFPTLRNITLCTEPEACALYTLQSAVANERCRVRPGDCFVVCDAGGGTVDLISYELESKVPFKIVPRTAAASVACGSTTLDRAFLKFLRDVLEPLDVDPNDLGTGGHYVLKPLAETILRRFIPVKHLFGTEGQTAWDINLPRNCRVLENPWAQSKVSNGVLRLTFADMKKIFDPSVNEILTYLARQVAQMAPLGKQVTHVFLSGGYSESPYLLSKVEEWAAMIGVEVERGEEAWGAVVLGAILKGAAIGSEMPAPVQFCPRNYGICVSQPYTDYQHDADDIQNCELQGYRLAKQQILWLAKKGDLLAPGEPIAGSQEAYVAFTSSDVRANKSMRVSFCATPSDDPETKLSQVTRGGYEVINLDVPFSDIPTANLSQERKANSRFGHFLKAYIKVKVRISTRVHIEVSCGGKTLAVQETSL